MSCQAMVRGLPREHARSPLVVEPGCARERICNRSVAHRSRRREACDRDVTRVLIRAGSLAYEAVGAVDHRGLECLQREREVPAAAGRVEVVRAAGFLRGPVLVGDGQASHRGRRDSGKRKMRLLLVPERPARGIAPGKVRQVHLPHAKERELESVLVAGGVLEMSGVVPPLDRRVQVRAVIPREREFASIGGCRECQHCGRKERRAFQIPDSRFQEAPPETRNPKPETHLCLAPPGIWNLESGIHLYSSRRAAAGSTDAARRPGKTPAASEAASTRSAVTARRPSGTLMATVQPKDCGLITASSREAKATAAASAAAVPVIPVKPASIKTARRT